nr:MAG TPA: hypothetical protein [Caudoviricetes sp.]
MNFDLLSNQCGDSREVYRLLYTSKLFKTTPMYSLLLVLYHAFPNISIYLLFRQI